MPCKRKFLNFECYRSIVRSLKVSFPLSDSMAFDIASPSAIIHHRTLHIARCMTKELRDSEKGESILRGHPPGRSQLDSTSE
jgi:hypothetical protein